MKIEKKAKGKGKGKAKGKAMIGIAMAAIMVASVMAAMLPTGSAISKGNNFNYIGAGVPAQTVLVGQNVQFNGTGFPNPWTNPFNVKVQKFVDGIWYDYRGPWTDGKAYNIDWDPELILRATDGVGYTHLSVEDPSIPLKLKVGTEEVSSIAVGTNLKIDTGGINLFDNDRVDLKIIGPDGQIKYDAINHQQFTNISVKTLKDWYGGADTTKTIETAGWTIGDYTFQVKTKSEYACGLDASSAVKDLEIRTAEIAIEADRTFCVELQTVKLTVTGVAVDEINVASSPLSPHVIFKAGIEDTPVDATNQFNDTIDIDGVRTYAVEFNDTGTYTITVTVTSGDRKGDYDTVDITVSEKGVTFDMPSTVIIGEKLDIKGTANMGTYVSVFVDDVLYSKLCDLVIEAGGTFSKEVTTTEVGMTVPGTVRLKAWIDCDKNPGDDPPTTPADGSTAILVLETPLDVSLTKTTAFPGSSFAVYGNASSNYVEIVAISPEGGDGTGMDGLYGTTIYTVPTFCNYTNYNFYKKIKVDTGADIGNYTILVLSPDRDEIYGNSGYSYIDSLLDLDGAGPELGAIDVSNKTQEEIVAIIEDIIYAAGSDDFMWMGNFAVTQFDTFDTGEGGYPSIMGTHNGTITIERMYTYPCTGTGGHSEYAAFYDQQGTEIGKGHWNGYQTGDYHYITFDAPFTLEIGETYNYTIRTGSYPQIIHNQRLTTENGTITCTEFTDANGKIYNNWIPAIRLE